MTTPKEAALHFLWGLALGMILGLAYDLLRPLRKKHNAPADLLFILFTFQIWLYLSFGICQGDIRITITAALGIGALLWINTLGKLIRPLFYGFWKGIYGIFAAILWPLKKNFIKNLQFWKKKCLHMGKKGVQ